MSDSSQPLLTVEALCGGYGAAQVLFELSLTVGRGEVVALMGCNGAGKSTAFKAIMGLLAVRRGQVRFMGHDISGWSAHRIARLGLGYVSEDRRIFTDLTEDENLAVGRQAARAWLDGVPAPTWRCDDLFALFPNLADMRQRFASRMSGGEQQMLTVARTLMGATLSGAAG